MNGCPSVTTGGQFLAQTLNHLDCQAQSLGSFGFQSLAASGSPASLALTGLLTLFIAIFAVRLLLGERMQGGEVVNAILKIGIVLTLAVSWPAFRVLAYDTVLLGPAEVASAITPETLPDTGSGFGERLQGVDTAIGSLTIVGAGEQTGSLALEDRKLDAFRAVAMQDETALGWSHAIYLGSVIGSLALVRIAGGLLLAIAPLFAGFLLFDFARGLFAGWLRGLVLVALGSLGLTILLAVEVAVIEPFLADTLSRRALGYATPSAPTELLAVTLAFGFASAGLLIFLGKIAFQNAWSFKIGLREAFITARAPAVALSGAHSSTIEGRTHARALTVSEGVTNLIRHEEARGRAPQLAVALPAPGSPTYQPTIDIGPRIGSSWRRTSGRTTAAHTQRDNRT